MNLTRLLNTAIDFRKLAEEQYSKIFGDNLLTFILSLVAGRFKREDLSSYIQTNKTMLTQMKGSIAWRGKNERDGLYGVDRNNNYVLLTKHNSPPKEYRTKSSSILKGVGAIPNLYLFVMEEDEWKKTREYPKELGHYSFIMQAFIQMFPWLKTESQQEYTSNVFDFVKTNKNNIDRLRRRFGYEPTFVSAGADGAVFAIGKDRILKLFKDHSAYQTALSAVGRVFKGHETGKTEAYIDDIGILGTFYENTVYYYTQEKMVPLKHLFLDDLDANEYIAEILANVKDYFYQNKTILERLRKMVNHPRTSDAVRMIASRIAERVKKDRKREIMYVNHAMRSRIDVRNDWLKILIEDMIVKYITNRTDLHAGNIGISNRSGGTLIYFDSAFEEPTEPPEEGLEYDMIRV